MCSIVLTCEHLVEVMLIAYILLMTSFIWFFFFFNDTAPTEIYTLSLHDALPIYRGKGAPSSDRCRMAILRREKARRRSEEHTSELQSPDHLVCRLLLEKKKKWAMKK